MTSQTENYAIVKPIRLSKTQKLLQRMSELSDEEQQEVSKIFIGGFNQLKQDIQTVSSILGKYTLTIYCDGKVEIMNNITLNQIKAICKSRQLQVRQYE